MTKDPKKPHPQALSPSRLTLFSLVLFLIAACDEYSDAQKVNIHHTAEEDMSAQMVIPDMESTERAPCLESEVTSVSGIVVNEDREPINQARAQVCVVVDDGRWLCLSPSLSDESGLWRVDLPADAQCLKRLAVRMIPPESAVMSASYCASQTLDTHTHFGLIELPVVRGGWRMIEASDPMIETLNFRGNAPLLKHPSGMILAIEDDTWRETLIAEGGLSSIRTREDCLSSSHGFDLTFSLSPEGFSRATNLLYLPTPTLTDGQEVELFAIGGLYSELDNGEVIEEGAATSLGKAIVQEGGIKTDIGLPFFNWIGIKSL